MIGRKLAISLLFVSFLPLTRQAIPETQPGRLELTVGELKRSRISGELGVPLGTAVEVLAEVVDGETHGGKGFAGDYLLKVIEVDGRKLTKPTVMRFKTFPFVRVKLPNNLHELAIQVHGTGSVSVSRADKLELERTFLQRPRHLIVSEGGSFTGLPRNLPRDVPAWQDSGYGFQSMLSVLAERTAADR